MTTLWQQLVSSRALRGIWALSFMKYFTKFLTLARLAVIARLLGPEQLGLFGLSVLVISITEVFTETGINAILLKDPKKFRQYYDTAWVISLIRGVSIAVLIFFGSGFIANIYNQPSLQYFLAIAASIPFLRGFINPAIIRFQQELQFERESVMRIGLQSLDLFSGLVLAFWLESAIGLLLGIAIAVVAEVVLSFTLFPERPNWAKARWQQARLLFQESKYIIGNGMIHYLTENIDDFLIGKYLGISALGFYQTAYKLASAATMDFAATVGQTLYPIYARHASAQRAVTRTWLKTNVLLLGVFLCAAVPFLLFTQPLVRLALGVEWLSIVPVVRILFVAGIAKAFITTWNPLSILANNLHHHVVMNIGMLLILVLGITLVAEQWGLVGASAAVLLAFLSVHPYEWFAVGQALRRLDHAK